jgi:hypothetical protein
VIDGRINVLMTLERLDAQSQGSLVYDATGGEGLRLEGSTDPQGRFEWREVLVSYAGGESRRQHTGTFRGTLSADRSSGDGTWASADGKRRSSLALTRVGESRTIASQDVDASVTYPQLDGPQYVALNAHLAAAARGRLDAQARSVRENREEAKAYLDPALLAHLTQSTACGVESVSPELVSLLCAVYDFSGGAHGNTHLAAENFALRPDGSFRTVGLWDVVVKSPANARRLSDVILRDLRRQEASQVLSGAITDLSPELNGAAVPVTIIPAGLAFHFEPYAVASYAEGTFRVVIPNRALGAMIRTDGPLAQRAAAK